ncbi:MAG TPA: hypothetical protein VF714_00320 [Jatrophihabitans sp.]|jgi:hypothetical protein
MTHAHGRWSSRHPDEDELVQAVDASAALRRLLAAASAPPSAAELKGRSRAIADFRAAQLPHSAETGLGTERKTESDTDTEPGTRPEEGGGQRAAGRLTLVCTAILVLLGGTAANAAAKEVPTALRNAVADLLTELAPADDNPPSSGTPAEQPEQPVQPGLGRTGPAPSGTG